MKKLIAVVSTILLTPFVAFADQINNLSDLGASVRGGLNALIPMMMALATIGFFWGVIKYLYAGSTEKLAEARYYIIFSIIALAVMFSVWGLVFMISNTFFESSPKTFTPTTSY